MQGTLSWANVERRHMPAGLNLIPGLLLAVLAWPWSPQFLTVFPVTSFQSALEMDAHSGLEFGTQVVFTYGPLGFLFVQQLNYAGTAVASFFFSLIFLTVIFASLLWALRRSLPLWGAIPVAYVVGAISVHTALGLFPEDVYAVILIVCVAVLDRSPEEPAPGWVWVGLGALLSVFALVKVSLGVGIVTILVITAASLPRGHWRAVKALALGATPTFCAAWFATGNSLGNLAPFARSSASIIRGYGAAMSNNYPHSRVDDLMKWAVILVIGTFAFAHGRKLTRRARIGVALASLVTVWLLFKEAFIRDDTYHETVFFAVALLLPAAFDLGRQHSRALLSGFTALCVATCVVAGGLPPLVYHPLTSAQNFLREASTLASSRQRARTIDSSRQLSQSSYAVPRQMLKLMTGHTVDMSAEEPTVAWAYPEVRFDSLPVIQDYNAYTPYLDQLDRSYLATPAAPRFILRPNAGASTDRISAFEPPATQMAIECRYRQVLASPRWQLLEWVGNRCGAERFLGTVMTEFNHWTTTPVAPRGDSVVATFHLSLGLGWTVQSLLFKPPKLFMGYNDGDRNWRFLAATGPDLHVLRAASTLGYSPAFAPVSVDRFRFFVDGWDGGMSGISVSFFAIPLAKA